MRAKLKVAIIDAIRITLFFSLVIPVFDMLTYFVDMVDYGIYGVRLSYFGLLFVSLLLYLFVHRGVGKIDRRIIAVPLLQAGIITYNFVHPRLVNIIFFTGSFSVVTPVLWTVALGPIAEELVFRGILYKKVEGYVCHDMAQISNFKDAIPVLVIVTVMFSIWHFNNYLFGGSIFRGGADLIWTLLQVLNAMFIGFMYTYLRFRTGGVISPIVAHIAHNFGSYLISV